MDLKEAMKISEKICGTHCCKNCPLANAGLMLCVDSTDDIYDDVIKILNEWR